MAHTLLGVQNLKSFMPYQDYESTQTLKYLVHNSSGFYKELQRYATSVTLSLLCGTITRLSRMDAN